MPKSSTLVSDAKRIESLIDEHAQSGPGLHKRVVSLRGALLDTILCWDTKERGVSENLKTLKMGWVAFRKRHSERINCWALALYLHSRRGISKKGAASLVSIPLGDINYVFGLMKRAKWSVHTLAVALDQNLEVRSEVDAYLEDLVVSLDERALEDMLLASVESYEVRARKRGRKYAECYGWCLGYNTRSRSPGTDKRFETTLRVTRVVTQIRAESGANFVDPNEESARSHRKFAKRFYPHLQLLGDYHTHPFGSVQKLKEAKGWVHSSTDRRQIVEWVEEVREDNDDPRFSIIVAVAAGGKSGHEIKRSADNRWKIGIDKLHLTIAAYRIRRDGSYDDRLKLKLSYLGGREG